MTPGFTPVLKVKSYDAGGRTGRSPASYVVGVLGAADGPSISRGRYLWVRQRLVATIRQRAPLGGGFSDLDRGFAAGLGARLIYGANRNE